MTIQPGAAWCAMQAQAQQYAPSPMPSAPTEVYVDAPMEEAAVVQNDEDVDDYYAQYRKCYDFTTRGMWYPATEYITSFFFCGAKWHDPKAPHPLLVCTSTADSNRRSKCVRGMSFLGYEVWKSHTEGHTAEGGRGMSCEPGGLNECEYLGIVADLYQDVPIDGINSMEGLLQRMGVTEYNRRPASGGRCPSM